MSAEAKFGVSLVPNLAMAVGCAIYSQFESTGALSQLMLLYKSYMYSNTYTFTQIRTHNAHFSSFPRKFLWIRIRYRDTI